jgi:hypothetical protein
MEVSGQLHAPGRFYPWERAPGTHWIREWVGPRGGLDAVVKRKIPNPRRESNPDRPARSSADETELPANGEDSKSLIQKHSWWNQ